MWMWQALIIGVKGNCKKPLYVITLGVNNSIFTIIRLNV